MEQAKSILRLLAWVLAVAPVAAAVALVRAHLRRRKDARRQHVQHLAADIVEIARSIELDLAALPRTSDAAELARRCADCRMRAEQAAALRGNVGYDAVEDAIGQLHDDHLRIVDLRSEVDATIAARRSGKPVARACKFATGSKPSRPRFNSTGALTRPSGFC